MRPITRRELRGAGSGNHRMLRRFVARLLVLLRWPAALLSSFLVALTLMSIWVQVWTTFPIWSGDVKADVILFPNTLRIFNVESSSWRETSFRTRCGLGYGWDWWSYNAFAFEKVNHGGYADIPLWLLIPLPAALAWTGFIAKRKQPRSGECAHCRHVLAGAALCPECGKACSPVGSAS